ncbi:MAG: restriction endonuclease subunit S [Sumerlaeia bacterium]
MSAERHVTVASKEMSEERLDTGFYSREFFESREILDRSGIPYVPIGSACEPWQFGAYALCNEIEWSDEKDGVPYLKAEALGTPLLRLESLMYVTPRTHSLLVKSRVRPGDIVVATSGTIGPCAILPETFVAANSNQDTIKFNPSAAGFDNYFVTAWLSTKFALAYMKKEGGGAVQQHIYLYNFKRLPLLNPLPPAQTYIGDKVRQAERLRARARELEGESSRLTSVHHVAEATQSPNPRTNRVTPTDMWPRLDSKYYGARALATLKATQVDGARIGDFVINVSNGFEERSFVDVGKPYITVTEVSSGRLDADHAPHIDKAVSIPPKAIIHERCVLVVRTGSIGTAVKVFHEDSGMAISSHLIRLEFEDEKTAACTAAFLNSPAGKILQHKISYGAVQPQIGQEELLALSVPQQFVDQADKLLQSENARESAIRFSARLTTAAKLLVEALIEGQVSEADLVAAQKALEAGDRSADRAILQRLTRKGMDAHGEPALFPDLDALYDALDALDGREGVEG